MKFLFTTIIVFISVACGGQNEPVKTRPFYETTDTVKVNVDVIKKTPKTIIQSDSLNQWLNDSLYAAEHGYWGC